MVRKQPVDHLFFQNRLNGGPLEVCALLSIQFPHGSLYAETPIIEGTDACVGWVEVCGGGAVEWRRVGCFGGGAEAESNFPQRENELQTMRELVQAEVRKKGERSKARIMTAA